MERSNETRRALYLPAHQAEPRLIFHFCGIGQGALIPGFEKGLLDMEINEKKTIKIPVTEAYGEVQKELLYEVKKEQLPQEMTPEVGMGLASKDENGREIQFRVAEVKEDSVIVDANHPLAGQDLTFELELIEIQ